MEETIKAQFQVKDENGEAVLDAEGKVTYQSVEAPYNFGDDLNDAVQLCGEDVVFSQFKKAAKVDLQGYMRTMLKGGASADQIAAKVAEWKPGMVTERVTVDPATAMAAAFENMNADERFAFLTEKLGLDPDQISL